MLQPDDRTERGAAARGLAHDLERQEIHGVALTYVDNAGITRVKTVPIGRLEHAATWGVGMSPVFDVFCYDDSITSSEHIGGPDGDLRLMPAVDRIRPLAAQPGWAWAPVDRYTQDGEEHPACRRSFARRMVERAAEAGVTATMSIEIEWAIGLAHPEGDFVPACSGPAYGMTRVVELSDYGRDLLVAFDQEGLSVDQLHPEYAAGQFEVSVAAADPVSAADLNVLARQTIRAVGLRHGLATSFAPAVVAGTVGNGSHVHLSLWRDGRNLFAGGDGPVGYTAEGQSFLAGVLDRLPELVAIGAPSVASYLRLVPSHWAGVFQCWGVENREAAIRVVPGTAGSREWSANAEVKCFDPSGNPYLVIGCVLAAGLADLGSGRTLPEPVTGDPAGLDRDIARLPQSLPEALEHLQGSTVLREAMGPALFEAFLAVRRAELEALGGLSPEEVVAATRWKY